MSGRRARLAVVVPAILIGTVCIVSGKVYMLLHRPAGEVFVDDWDRNTRATAPAAFQALQGDPVLHRMAVEKTEVAFRQGGWNAASQVFYKIIDDKVNAYASDKAVLACHAAWVDLFRAVLPMPKVCRAVIEGGAFAVPAGVATGALHRMNDVCDAMTIDGGAQRLGIDPPHRASKHDYDAMFARALEGPRKLTDAERRAMNRNGDTGQADDATLCSARIALGDNVAALPAAQAARYVRTSYATGNGDFVYDAPDTGKVVGGPPPDVHCAAPGTRFVLSMEASDGGRPIVWESLGQKGWDCRFRSSVSGEHGLFMWDGDYLPDNALHQLWPLQVGRVAQCHCGTDTTEDFKVASLQHYWLPSGSVDAYAIETTTRSDGVPQYTVTDYWAPSLGFYIGHRTVVQQGSFPDGGSPDWQVVAMLPKQEPPARPALPNVIRPGPFGAD